ncbi:protein-glutamate methylesterase/protein-glutamine glutaminase [Aneurinibacillus aneurinilyticus]|uniref:Protein-glutamate methylesterase/protein-glutamine glutaminase n=1 Tax=Aneurinibacillus aneurinilyticus ATCC 12856 TaxID=649747 RepID=U1X2N1_ANEAE|nr:chemotaxis response regulator protein-glutamate methylesterase [Aneurinibacillus aneurinilyticus]ERI09230.1 response regulator receiver domain protein [Aneurinibacillus aneurinilyticus ATCC 12856]MED0707414.1 chemotaxis response regulator protein-glutamate methylesterase [Aneurinibacillus aneurinilyticus]MED0724778.1 chemotaxis response regulator protein-glutamate methylesterase [Aneurinibacillus aneurinilyticus]MED0733228.1 chemotaxis response regulator protein-glutamate methylesterase [Ane
MQPIRVVVIDDSAFMRKVIGDLLEQDPGIQVVAKGRNGSEAMGLIKKWSPDVVTLDVEMPVMNGLEALATIMKEAPLPVVMLSSLTKQGANETILALEMGAVDFIPKPSGAISLDLPTIGTEIVQKVKAAAHIKVSRLLQIEEKIKSIHSNWIGADKSPLSYTVAGKKATNEIQAGERSDRLLRKGKIENLIAVGTSTGGPKALQVLLKGIPQNFKGSLVIVQHMPPGFTKSLAQRLNSLCEIEVSEAEDNQVLQEGHAYIAPGNYHMEVKQRTDGEMYISLNQAQPRGGHRPSVDTLFESITHIRHHSKYAIIMTGMGNDGTAGLKKLKETGVRSVIAEDESTCVVFGMPRAAIQAGTVDIIAPLHEISVQLMRCLNC